MTDGSDRDAHSDQHELYVGSGTEWSSPDPPLELGRPWLGMCGRAEEIYDDPALFTHEVNPPALSAGGRLKRSLTF